MSLRRCRLVPKQLSTGDRTILGKISKRGNRRNPVREPDAKHCCWRRRRRAVDGLTGRDRGDGKYFLDAVQLV